jgi:hypothetical protein
MVAADVPGKPGRTPVMDRGLVEVLDDEAQVLESHSVMR